MQESKSKSLKMRQSAAAKPSRVEGSVEQGEDGPVFSMGLDTFRVPMSLHSENRARLVARLRAAGKVSGVVLLQGGNQESRYDTDHEPIFRQESYFNYLFGVKEGGFFGAIDIATGKCTLFSPRLPEEYATWMGAILAPSDFREMYAVDDALYADELGDWASKRISPSCPLFLLHGLNTDSGSMTKTTATFPGLAAIEAAGASAAAAAASAAAADSSSAAAAAAAAKTENATVDRKTLHALLAECRVYKSPSELRLMRYVSKVTCLAHAEVMRRAREGMAEYQLESLFKHHIYTHGGCRHEAYTCICACGPNPAVLHYGHAGAPNARIVRREDMALLDMGAEYHCYCSDITCSFPLSGVFSADQRFVYEGVFNAQLAVMETLRPGKDWTECHVAAWRCGVRAMIAAGVLVPNPISAAEKDVDGLIALGLGRVFMPHGLGHFIGCDTHDVGGYLPHFPARSKTPGVDKLRTACILGEGMVLTVEPGIYFIDHLLDQALCSADTAPYINAERLKDFRGTGGVRLEDVVVITATGFENFTVAPRTIGEVEAVRAGGAWPPPEGTEDQSPGHRRLWASKEIPVVNVPPQFRQLW